MSETDNEERRQYLVERITQCGAEYNHGILFGPKAASSFDLVHKSHRSKLEKLSSGGYQTFERYELFVRSYIYITNTMADEALSLMIQDAANFQHSFSLITVTVPDFNYRFDLEHGTYTSCKFDQSDQYSIGKAARQWVIDKQLE